MKNTLKCLVSLFLGICLIMPVPMNIFAHETDQVIAVEVSENETYYFSTQEDYHSYLKHQESNGSGIQPHGEFTTTQEIARQNLNMKFVGYHRLTPTWTKAAAYTIRANESSTAKINGSFNGLSYTLTVTHSLGVDTTIPADRNRFSRLAHYGDFVVKHMRTNYHDQSGIYDMYDYISTQTINTYLLVQYQ